MTRLMFVAAAFAAGLAAFAANAQEGGAGDASPKKTLAAAPAEMAQKTAKKAEQAGEKTRGKYLMTYDDGTPFSPPPAKDGNAQPKAQKASPKANSVTTAEQAPAKKNAKAKKAAKAEKSSGKKASQVAAAQKVDLIKTSAVAPRQKPQVTLKARKEVKGLAQAETVSPKTAAKAAAIGGGYHSIVSRYAAEYGIPASLAHAVITVESNYRANARGSAGEIGLMQIKPATARGLGYSGSAKGLFNPETNIRYGMLYLAKAHQLAGGNTCGTILRYNAGHGARRMNPVSAAYCSKVKRHLGS